MVMFWKYSTIISVYPSWDLLVTNFADSCFFLDKCLKFPGANGLANSRDFETPTGKENSEKMFSLSSLLSAWYEDRDVDFTVVHKYQGSLFESKLVNFQLTILSENSSFD